MTEPTLPAEYVRPQRCPLCGCPTLIERDGHAFCGRFMWCPWIMNAEGQWLGGRGWEAP